MIESLRVYPARERYATIDVAVLLASMLVAGDGLAKESGNLKARWQREYPRAAAEWEAVSRNFIAKGSYMFRYGKGDIEAAADFTVASSNDKRLYILDKRTFADRKSPDSPVPRDTLVACETAEYAFELTKPAGTDSYRVEGHGPYKGESDVLFQFYFQTAATSATVFGGISLLERMNHPSFILKSIETLKQDTVELVRLTYSYEEERVRESGTVDLDPGKNWAIRRVEIQSRHKKDGDSVKLSVDVGYETVDDTRHFPRRIETFQRFEPPDVYQHTVVSYRNIKLGSVPDEIFRLSAYGIPDIPLRAKRRSIFTWRNPFLWLSLAAATGSFTLLWLLRKQRARTA